MSLCKAKNAKNGTLEISLGPRVIDLQTLYIWNLSHLVNILSTYIWPHPFLCSCHAKKGQKWYSARQTLGTTT